MPRYCITIAREFASGGRLIGQKLAALLNIPFYDKELISLTAKESGFAESAVEEAENTKTRSLLYNLSITATELPVADQIFIAQSRVIEELAKRDSCVFVGRASDYALRKHDGCINVFIYAPIEERVKRARDEYKISERNLELFIRREDKKRAAYYEYCTQRKWGIMPNYHLCINSTIGLDAAAEAIHSLVKL